VVLRARGPHGDRSGETWDFAFVFESGERLLLRFVLTNLGPGERNAAAVWHWIDRSGAVVEYDNGQRKGGWSLEQDNRVVHIKSSVLDLRRPTLRVRMTKKRAQIDLAIELPAAPLHVAIDGDDRFELWATHAKVRGSYWKRGMADKQEVRGTGSLFYSWVGDEGRELRRVEFVSFDPGSKIYATTMLWEDGAPDGWAFFEAADGSRRVTHDVVACPASGDDYVWPERILIDGEKTRAEIRVDPPFLRYDALSGLPGAIGVFVRWVYQPMRLWSEASLTIDEAEAAPIRGALRSTFGNPLAKDIRRQLGADPRCRRPR
jgi:hypothetical protein